MPDEAGYAGPPIWGLGVTLTFSLRENSVVSEGRPSPVIGPKRRRRIIRRIRIAIIRRRRRRRKGLVINVCSEISS